MLESLTIELVDCLDTWIARNTKDSLVSTRENLEDDHNLTYVRKAPKQATQGLLMSMIDGEEVKVSLEAAIIVITTSPTIV